MQEEAQKLGEVNEIWVNTSDKESSEGGDDDGEEEVTTPDSSPRTDLLRQGDVEVEVLQDNVGGQSETAKPTMPDMSHILMSQFPPIPSTQTLLDTQNARENAASMGVDDFSDVSPGSPVNDSQVVENNIRQTHWTST